MKARAALVELLHFLRLQNYSFTPVTPKTHATVLSRSHDQQPDVRDIFGWNKPFAEADLDPRLLSLLDQADAIAAEGRSLKSRVRVASLGSDLFIHSAFPTDEPDAVFFGPDTFRFARFIRQHGNEVRGARMITDMGAGSGAGGIVAARLAQEPAILLVDVNSRALQLADVNATAAGVTVQLEESDQVPEGFDLLIGNAPYLMDAARRAYRHGGDLLGGAVSLDWVSQGLDKLRPGATILLYTGAAVSKGYSPFLAAVSKACAAARVRLSIEELDPDVFGDELLEEAYSQVERIAAVGVKIQRPFS